MKWSVVIPLWGLGLSLALRVGGGCVPSWLTSCAPSWLLFGLPLFSSQLVIAIYKYITHCISATSGDLSSSSLNPMSWDVGCAIKSLWAPDTGQEKYCITLSILMQWYVWGRALCHEVWQWAASLWDEVIFQPDCFLIVIWRGTKDLQVNNSMETTFQESPVIAASACSSADLHECVTHRNDSWGWLSVSRPLCVCALKL